MGQDRNPQRMAAAAMMCGVALVVCLVLSQLWIRTTGPNAILTLSAGAVLLSLSKKTVTFQRRCLQLSVLLGVMGGVAVLSRNPIHLGSALVWVGVTGAVLISLEILHLSRHRQEPVAEISTVAEPVTDTGTQETPVTFSPFLMSDLSDLDQFGRSCGREERLSLDETLGFREPVRHLNDETAPGACPGNQQHHSNPSPLRGEGGRRPDEGANVASASDSHRSNPSPQPSPLRGEGEFRDRLLVEESEECDEDLEEEFAEPDGEQILHAWTRRRLPEEESLEGSVIAEFPAGQKQIYVHVPFLPGFSGLPRGFCFCEEETLFAAEFDILQTYGGRLNVRRRGDVNEAAETTVSFSVTAPRSSQRAA